MAYCEVRGYFCHVAASAKERRHFERIRAAKVAEGLERAREAIERPSMERVIEGLELGEMASSTPQMEEALDRRALGQAELSRLARRLGLR